MISIKLENSNWMALGLREERGYEDGTAADHSLPCPDWFADGVPERDGIALTPVWNGMDRLGPGGLDERNDAALFEAVVELSGGKTIRALILRPGGARFQRPQGLFHLFAATAVRAGPPGGEFDEFCRSAFDFLDSEGVRCLVIGGLGGLAGSRGARTSAAAGDLPAHPPRHPPRRPDPGGERRASTPGGGAS
jgi:hypothetical protein